MLPLYDFKFHLGFSRGVLTSKKLIVFAVLFLTNALSHRLQQPMILPIQSRELNQNRCNFSVRHYML